MPESAPKKPQITVRRLAPGDLEPVLALLERRDERRYDKTAASAYLFELDPDHFAGWIAFDGEEPVGLTTLYLRKLEWANGETVTAGYWSHLFVDERYRNAMVYPRLVLGMMKESPGLGIDLIYTGTRRPHVAETHVKMGFQELGKIVVGVKPLRPAELLGRHKGIGLLTVVSAPVDAVYHALQVGQRGRLRGDAEIGRVELNDPGVAEWLEKRVAVCRGLVSQKWTVEDFRRRFAGTLEGGAYKMILAKRGQVVVGGVLFRFAERGNGLKLGVILDLVAKPDEPELARDLLLKMEDTCHAAGCLAVLHLDGAGELSEAMSRAGYRRSSEEYHMLAWPKTKVPEGSDVADLAHWRFPFAEHDAF